MKNKIFILVAPLLIFLCQFCFWQPGYANTATLDTIVIPAANVCVSSLNVPIHAFSVYVSGGTSSFAYLRQFTFTTTGTYIASDILNFKLWASAINDFSTATQCGANLAPTGPGVQTFPNYSSYIGIAKVTTEYFWITMDIAASATSGNTIQVSATVPADFVILTGITAYSGSTDTSGTQTFYQPITVQPVDQLCSTGITSFSVTTTGGGLTYQWQEFISSWNNITNGGIYSGATTDILTLTGVTTSMNNYTYRCVVTNACSINSTSATLRSAYSGSSVTQDNIANINPGTSNAEIIGIRIVVAAGCSPTVTSFALNTTGSTNPGTDITTANVYYTGSSSVFTTTTLFGTLASPNGSFAITGTQTLSAGTNYFWLTYDVPAGATVGDVVDAECTSLTIGTANYTPSPTSYTGSRRIGGFLPSWKAAKTIAASNTNAVTVCTNGSAMSFGYNNHGQIGDNTILEKHVPTAVWTISNIISVGSGGYYFSLGLKNDGTVWAWGDNTVYQLGDGTTTERRTPVQVLGPGGVGFLTGIIQVSSGYQHSLALKSDSTVWAWGNNPSGQLGDGTTTNRSTPVQVVGPGGVGFLTGIVAVSSGNDFSIALKNDGTVWAWGKNAEGALGNNSPGNTPSSTPVQVLAGASGCGTYLCNIFAIDAGADHVLAVKNDGTVWAWGNNFFGQLGNGLAPVFAGGCWCIKTPVQVVTGASGCTTNLCNITDISAGYNQSIALRNDGTVWAWGLNSNGQLGDNTLVDKNAPVQVLGPGGVGFLTGIRVVSTGWNGSYAIKNDSTLWSWGGNSTGQIGDNTTTQRQTPVQTIGLCKISLVPLPIELLYFNAIAKNNSLVKCYWSTATEINSDYFAVERSQYGINFEQIGTVKGAGNSSVTRNYIFYDHEPYSGISYYRLRPMDYNGAFTYSEIRPVYIGTLDIITIYPNPSTDGSIQYIIASEDGGELSVKVYDIIGRKVISNTETLESGVVTRKLSTAALSSGSYLLQVTNGDLEKTQKQFVIK
ncbi:MAG: T9SS type A sorting domain-containing protein [Bacteroidetes bacterium]|nr:T9SS type A sorting domain-containing protein [Bacteroidota bacterium]